jgi:hypothetical protein
LWSSEVLAMLAAGRWMNRQAPTKPSESAMKIVLGVVLVIVGCVFTLQGLGYLAGSPMTGATLWAIVGPIVAVVGIMLVVRAAQTGRSGRTS